MGLTILLATPIALANPELLIDVFVLLVVVLYTFSSFRFLVKGIDKNQAFKYSFRDFIIVNSLASVMYIGRTIWQFITSYTNQTEIKKVAKEFAGLQPSGSMLTEAMIQTAIKAGLLFTLFYVVVLGAHIAFTIVLVKRHNNLFIKPSSG